MTLEELESDLDEAEALAEELMEKIPDWPQEEVRVEANNCGRALRMAVHEANKLLRTPGPSPFERPEANNWAIPVGAQEDLPPASFAHDGMAVISIEQPALMVSIQGDWVEVAGI